MLITSIRTTPQNIESVSQLFRSLAKKLRGSVGGPLLVGGLGPGPPCPPNSGPAVRFA